PRGPRAGAACGQHGRAVQALRRGPDPPEGHPDLAAGAGRRGDRRPGRPAGVGQAGGAPVSASTKIRIGLDPVLDPNLMQPVFRRAKRLHVPGVLTLEAATALHEGVARTTPWKRSLFLGDRGVALDPAELDAMPADKREALDLALADRARRGFQ